MDVVLSLRRLRAGGESPLAARYLAQVEDVPRLTPAAHARIETGLAPAARPRGRRALWWVVVSLGITSAAVGGTVVHTLMRPRVSPILEQPQRHRAPARVIAPTAPEIAEAPPADAPAATTRRARPAHRPRVVTASAPPVAPTPPPSTLAEESRVLESALLALRQKRDGGRALALLDDYARRFPDGELAHEAERTRVESLLLLGRSSAALTLLDGMSFGRAARDTGLIVVRGELRAQAGRLAQAEGDFAQVLTRTSGDSLAARALYGRASCRLRQGRHAEARADLREYLHRFPQGAHAVEVKQALERP